MKTLIWQFRRGELVGQTRTGSRREKRGFDFQHMHMVMEDWIFKNFIRSLRWQLAKCGYLHEDQGRKHLIHADVRCFFFPFYYHR